MHHQPPIVLKARWAKNWTSGSSSPESTSRAGLICILTSCPSNMGANACMYHKSQNLAGWEYLTAEHRASSYLEYGEHVPTCPQLQILHLPVFTGSMCKNDHREIWISQGRSSVFSGHACFPEWNALCDWCNQTYKKHEAKHDLCFWDFGSCFMLLREHNAKHIQVCMLEDCSDTNVDMAREIGISFCRSVMSYLQRFWCIETAVGNRVFWSLEDSWQKALDSIAPNYSAKSLQIVIACHVWVPDKLCVNVNHEDHDASNIHFQACFGFG